MNKNLTDVEVDTVVKIKGTIFDRRRRLTDDQIKAAQLWKSAGFSNSYIAKMLKVSENCIRYNTDMKYKKETRIRNKQYKYPCDKYAQFISRVKYKRELLDCVKE